MHGIAVCTVDLGEGLTRSRLRAPLPAFGQGSVWSGRKSRRIDSCSRIVRRLKFFVPGLKSTFLG